jgi:hypothetical protein
MDSLGLEHIIDVHKAVKPLYIPILFAKHLPIEMFPSCRLWPWHILARVQSHSS